MKILLFITNIDVQGAQSVAAELASGLMRSGNEVAIIINTDERDNILVRKMHENGVRIIFNKYADSSYLARNVKIFSIIADFVFKWKPDAINVHLDYTYMWIFSFVFGIGFFETFHSQPYRIKEVCSCKLFRNLFNRNLIYPVLLSEHNKTEFENEFDICGSKLEIIPNPVNTANYINGFKNRSYRAAETVKFVFTARFHPVKNHHLLITSFHCALKQCPNLELYLAGTGELMEQEKKYTHELGIGDKVFFLGYVEDIPKLLEQSDVFVLSSISECFPVCIIEAMASGLPVIATEVGGVRDIVRGNGVLVPPDDSNKFAEAIVRLALDPELREEMGRLSAEMSSDYESDLIVKKYEKLFLLGEKHE